MSMRSYLDERFVGREAFCSHAGISPRRLDAILRAGAAPGPSYIGTGHSLWSAAFGLLPCDEPILGEYFRPECARWASLAAAAPEGMERTSSISVLAGELRDTLSMHIQDPAAVEDTVRGCLKAFADGTLGVCVADPSTGHGIAKKVLLQGKLSSLASDGELHLPSGLAEQDVLRLVDEYSAASMPFSPLEYPLSSRKRLVDDLRAAVAERKCPAPREGRTSVPAG